MWLIDLSGEWKLDFSGDWWDGFGENDVDDLIFGWGWVYVMG